MGLDMYLSKKIYVWRENRHKLKLSELDREIDPQKVSYIVEEAGYWRKANAIHGWFVDNVQKGVDDCRECYVSEDHMQKLLDTVNEVLGASELVKGKIQNGIQYKDGGDTLGHMNVALPHKKCSFQLLGFAPPSCSVFL